MANDETLWRSLLRVKLQEPSCSLAPRKVSWKQEYKRVYYHSPVVHTETLSEHTDEVLHVSFAHGGHLFSTTSKDATLRVSLIWAGTRENLSSGVWEQQRCRPACASLQFDHCLCHFLIGKYHT